MLRSAAIWGGQDSVGDVTPRVDGMNTFNGEHATADARRPRGPAALIDGSGADKGEEGSSNQSGDSAFVF